MNEATIKTIDMTTEVVDEKGESVPDMFGLDPRDNPISTQAPELTVGRAISHALFFIPQNDTTSAEQKWARGAMAEKLRENKAAVLTAGDVVVIKRLLGVLYGPLIIAQIFPLLDPNAEPPSLT